MIQLQLSLENYNRDISFRMLLQIGNSPEVLGGHARQNSPTRNILTQSSSTALVTTGRSDPGFQIDRNSDRRLSAVSSAPLGSLVSRGFQALMGIIAPSWGATPNVPFPTNVPCAGSRAASPDPVIAL